MEVKEEFVKLNREDVELYLKHFKATTSIVYAAETWKNKSIPITSQKCSGHILNKHVSENQQIQSQKDSLFSNLLDYFKDIKVSDIKYEENDKGKDCPYIPWATRILQPTDKDEGIQTDNTLENMIVLHTPFKCHNAVTIRRESRCCDYNRENKLKLPLNYNGSEMLMPNGDQLFWVRIKGRLQVDFVTT